MRTAAGAAALAAAMLLACPADAQLPHLDPLPHFSAADSTSRKAAVFDIDRFHDPETTWTTHRLLTTVLLPAGGRGAFYLRLPLLTADRDELTVAERWPDVIGTDVSAGWPHERIGSGIGQVEVGVVGPFGIGPLREWRYGIALGLPTAGNDLYPWSAGGMPLRLQLRPGIDLGGGRYLWLQGGYLLHLDAAREELTEDAFPNGPQLGAELAWYRGRGHRWLLTWDWEDRDGRLGTRVGAAVWLPWTDAASIGLRVSRSLQDAAHRPALWHFTLSFRFDGARGEPGNRTRLGVDGS